MKIPPESLIGAHIHERHGLPKSKYIPKDTWRFIADENQFKARKDRQFHILLDILFIKMFIRRIGFVETSLNYSFYSAYAKNVNKVSLGNCI